MDYNVDMSKPTCESIESTNNAGDWVVYILQCSDGTLYTGMTSDVTRRVEQHNAGTAARYTRARTPVKLVYREPAKNRSAALKREYAIKQLSRNEKDALITQHNNQSRPG